MTYETYRFWFDILFYGGIALGLLSSIVFLIRSHGVDRNSDKMQHLIRQRRYLLIASLIVAFAGMIMSFIGLYCVK